MLSDAEKRRAVIQDLLIGVGLPILQIVARECAQSFATASCLYGCDQEYVVSTNRYNIFEDFGPVFAIELTPLSFILFYAWPVAIGTVSLFYCGKYSGLSSLFGALGAH
jgi:pheromone a factor receptor